ncbi:hypothetical protein Z043_107219, partial [Scleropages formosus]
ALQQDLLVCWVENPCLLQVLLSDVTAKKDCVPPGNTPSVNSAGTVIALGGNMILTERHHFQRGIGLTSSGRSSAMLSWMECGGKVRQGSGSPIPRSTEQDWSSSPEVPPLRKGAVGGPKTGGDSMQKAPLPPTECGGRKPEEGCGLAELGFMSARAFIAGGTSRGAATRLLAVLDRANCRGLALAWGCSLGSPDTCLRACVGLEVEQRQDQQSQPSFHPMPSHPVLAKTVQAASQLLNQSRFYLKDKDTAPLISGSRPTVVCTYPTFYQPIPCLAIFVHLTLASYVPQAHLHSMEEQALPSYTPKLDGEKNHCQGLTGRCSGGVLYLPILLPGELYLLIFSLPEVRFWRKNFCLTFFSMEDRRSLRIESLCSYEPAFISLHCLPLAVYINSKAVVMAYKSVKGSDHSQNLSKSDTLLHLWLFVVTLSSYPKSKVCWLLVLAPMLWNKLLLFLRTAEALSMFNSTVVGGCCNLIVQRSKRTQPLRGQLSHKRIPPNSHDAFLQSAKLLRTNLPGLPLCFCSLEKEGPRLPRTLEFVSFLSLPLDLLKDRYGSGNMWGVGCGIGSLIK